MRWIGTILILSLLVGEAMGYEQAFKQTEPGEIELKVLPAGRLLESKGSGSYFKESGSLFRPLFNYIKSHDISMTTPVEARIEPGVMYFWVAADQAEKADEDTDEVKVIDVPERRVVAIGVKGAYTEENFEEAEGVLLDWIENRDDLTMIGEPYAVYWNGPFTLWFMKKFEVQVEIARD